MDSISKKEAGYRYLASKQFGKAKECFNHDSLLGDKEASYVLGCMHYYDEDFENALKYFLLAASQGDDEALCKVGIMYEMGQGVDKNLKEAFSYYLRGSQRGSYACTFHLALFYLRGISVEMNIKKGLALLHEAADHGYEPAIYNLALIYYYGQYSLTSNEEKGIEYLKRCVELKYGPALLFYSELIEDGIIKEDKSKIEELRIACLENESID